MLLRPKEQNIHTMNTVGESQNKCALHKGLHTVIPFLCSYRKDRIKATKGGAAVGGARS